MKKEIQKGKFVRNGMSDGEWGEGKRGNKKGELEERKGYRRVDKLQKVMKYKMKRKMNNKSAKKKKYATERQIDETIDKYIQTQRDI